MHADTHTHTHTHTTHARTDARTHRRTHSIQNMPVYIWTLNPPYPILPVPPTGALNYLHSNDIAHRDLKLENFIFDTGSYES